jgi:hypothetical protein
MAIEYYKEVHGSYPSKLDDLDRSDTAFLYDTSFGLKGALIKKFHQYQLLPDGLHYTLFDVGPDKVPGTADDLYPVILDDEASHIGYVRK